MRAALSSWWSVFGVLAASVTGFNLLRNALRVEPSALFAEIIRAYDHLVHQPIILIIQMIGAPIPRLWMVDATIVWLFIGGIVLRSAWVIRSGLLQAGENHHRPMINPVWRGLINVRALLPLFVLSSLLCWPIVVAFLCEAPFVYSHKWERVNIDTGERLPLRLLSVKRVRGVWQNTTYLYDLRIVLLTQAVVATCCVATWFVLNALLRLYG